MSTLPLRWLAGPRRSPTRRRPGARGLLAVVAVSLWTGACNPSEHSLGETDYGFIAVVGAGQDDPLWPVLRGSALRQKDMLGKIGLRAEAPPATSTFAQVQIVQRLQQEGMRGLCLQVIDPAAIAPHLNRLVNEGVAVVTLLHPVKAQQPLMHCGLDDMLIGEALADLIAEALQDKGTVAVLHAKAASPQALERYDAFYQGLKRHQGITVLREFDCGGNPQRAQDMIRRCLERYPRLNGWVALDNWPFRGLNPQERLVPPSCKLVTTDPHPENWGQYEAGVCYGMIAADYGSIAREAVLMCATALEGKPLRWRTYLAKPHPLRASELHTFKMLWFEWSSREGPSP